MLLYMSTIRVNTLPSTKHHQLSAETQKGEENKLPQPNTPWYFMVDSSSTEVVSFFYDVLEFQELHNSNASVLALKSFKATSLDTPVQPLVNTNIL